MKVAVLIHFIEQIPGESSCTYTFYRAGMSKVNVSCCGQCHICSTEFWKHAAKVYRGKREKTWPDSEKFRFQPQQKSLSAVYVPDAVWEIVPCFFWQRF